MDNNPLSEYFFPAPSIEEFFSDPLHWRSSLLGLVSRPATPLNPTPEHKLACPFPYSIPAFWQDVNRFTLEGTFGSDTVGIKSRWRTPTLCALPALGLTTPRWPSTFPGPVDTPKLSRSWASDAGLPVQLWAVDVQMQKKVHVFCLANFTYSNFWRLFTIFTWTFLSSQLFSVPEKCPSILPLGPPHPAKDGKHNNSSV